MLRRDERALVTRAERLLHRATRDALTRTAVLLSLIAEGQVDPSAAAVAAGQLRVLLAAVGDLERVGAGLRRKATRGPASRVVH